MTQQAFKLTRQRPTFPLPRGGSIIGLGGLNFRVRYGNGCGPSGMVTGNIVSREASRVVREVFGEFCPSSCDSRNTIHVSQLLETMSIRSKGC